MLRETQGVLLALGAAASFGLVNATAKATSVHPVLAGALAYLIAGLALAPTLRRARIEKRDRPRMLLMSLAGGAIAPALLFVGLTYTSAASASLLLTLEMVFTALLAAAFLQERPQGRTLVGLVLLFAASILVAIVTSVGDASGTSLVGALLVGGAALAWGLDNTISTKLVGVYQPHHVLALKGLIGGGAALLVALLLRAPLTITLPDIGRLLFIGLIGVALSVVLFYHALQRIGATRTSAIFLPTTALAGVVAAIILLNETLRPAHAISLVLIAVGTWLVTRPR